MAPNGGGGNFFSMMALDGTNACKRANLGDINKYVVTVDRAGDLVGFEVGMAQGVTINVVVRNTFLFKLLFIVKRMYFSCDFHGGNDFIEPMKLRKRGLRGRQNLW